MTYINTRTGIGALCALALLGAACSDQDSGEDPAAIIETYITEYNAGDLEGVVALFADDATMIGHPFEALATGRDQIRAVHAQEVDGAGTYTISNLAASGNAVSWDHVWVVDADGRRVEFCVDGHAAIVEEGHITSWTWPDTTFQCDG